MLTYELVNRAENISEQGHQRSSRHVRFPDVPPLLKSVYAWFGILSLIGAAVVFFASRISPKFTVDYQDLRNVPLAEINKGFGFPANPAENDVGNSLLRISVVNNSSLVAQSVNVVVADYILRLAFVLDANGSPITTYSVVPSGGNTSRLVVPIGDLPPYSEQTIFVGGKSLLVDLADVHAESSNLGKSDSGQMDELSGFQLFMGRNAGWVLTMICLLFGTVLLARETRK